MSGTTSESLNKPLQMAPVNTLIRAGAGAGKTTELINRVLGQILYFQKTQDRDPRLVVTTFTRKATQEIRERLLGAAQNLGDPRVLKYVQTSPFLSIATIHASLQKFLSLYGNKIGLAPEYGFVGGVELHRLEKRALRQVLDQPGMVDLFSNLLEEWDLHHFWEAFHFWSQQKVMTPEMNPLTIEELQSGRQKILKEVQSGRADLAQQLSGLKLTAAWQTFLEMCQAPRTLDFAQESELWKNAPVTRKTKEISEELNDAKKRLSETGKSLSGWEFSEEFLETHEKLRRIFPVVAQALLNQLDSEKRRRGVLAMADLENWSLRLAREYPESARAFSETWDFWMIDEYQDTSPLQVEILRRLIGEKPEFVVGDPQQSIYLFRGARSQVFMDKESEMKEMKSELLSKMTNYRSKPSLMAFINELLPTMSAQFQPMETNPVEKKYSYQGVDAVAWALPETPEPEQDSAEPDVVSLQTRALANRIEELLKLQEPPSSICILARTNAEVSEISEGLQSCGLPVFSHRPLLPYRRREVRDALSYLKFLVQPHDNQNLIELLRSPWFRVDDEILFNLAHSFSESFWSRRKKLDPPSPVLTALEQDLQSVNTEGVFYRWLEGLKLRGFFDFSYVIDPSGQREANLWKLVSELRWNERSPGFSYMQFIEDRLEETGREDQVSDEVPAVVEPSRVQVMTIHASKGLEFEHVMLVSAGEINIRAKSSPIIIDEGTGRFSFALRTKEKEEWSNTPWADEIKVARKEREFEEYDRLLYVALTRAKQSLTVIWEKPKKESWAHRWPDWLPLEPGEHSIGKFRVQVRTDLPREVRFEFSEQEKFKPKSPWKTIDQLRREIPDLSTANTWEGLQLISTGIETHSYLESLQENWDTEESLPAKLRDQLLKDKNINFEHLIKNGFVEWGFVLKEGDSLRQGRIDLWGRDEQGVPWIVDYKTGNPKYRDQAIAQLKDYARALIQLKQIESTEKIQLYPLYLSNMRDSKPEFFVDKD